MMPKDDLSFDHELLDQCVRDVCADCCITYGDSPKLIELISKAQASEDGARLFRLAAAHAMTVSSALMVANDEGMALVVGELNASSHEDPSFWPMMFATLDVMSRQTYSGSPELPKKIESLVQVHGAPLNELLAR